MYGVLVNKVEASRETTAKPKQEVERQKKLVSIAEKSTNNALNDVMSLCERVAFAGTREAELLSNESTTLNKIATATAELRQARDTISTQSRELAKIAQLKMSIKSLQDNVAFYEASEESLKGELAAVTMESTRLGQLFDSVVQKWLTYKRSWVQEVLFFDPSLKINVPRLSHLSGA